MLEAVIFDMNGVLINDEKFHQEAWRRFTRDHHEQLSDEDFKRFIFGKTEKEAFPHVFNHELTDAEVATFADERVDTAIGLVRPHLAETAGLTDFLNGLKEDNLKIGLATNSRKNYLDFILDALEIRTYFDTVVTAEDISSGKPDPEIYTLTAKRLGVVPGHVVAIEDSIAGLQSAHAAGMKVVAITSTHTAEELKSAELIVNSFTELAVPQVALLVSG